MVKEVALNIFAQIMFFIVNIFVIPWLGRLVIAKYGDAVQIVRKHNECKDEAERKKITDVGRVVLNIYVVMVVINSWTFGLIATLIRFFIYLITFNRPKLKFRIGTGDRNKDGSFDDPKFSLIADITNDDLRFKETDGNLVKLLKILVEIVKTPIQIVGGGLSKTVGILGGPILSLTLLSLMLPSTFSSVILGFLQWMPTQGGVNGEFFARLYSCFVDIAWNRLVVGGFIENPIFFTIFLICFIFSCACGVYCDVAEDFIQFVFYSLVVTLIITVLNIVFAVLHPAGYSIVANYINIVGIAVLFVIILQEIASFVSFCTTSVLKLIINKINPL